MISIWNGIEKVLLLFSLEHGLWDIKLDLWETAENQPYTPLVAARIGTRPRTSCSSLRGNRSCQWVVREFVRRQLLRRFQQADGRRFLSTCPGHHKFYRLWICPRRRCQFWRSAFLSHVVRHLRPRRCRPLSRWLRWKCSSSDLAALACPHSCLKFWRGRGGPRSRCLCRLGRPLWAFLCHGASCPGNYPWKWRSRPQSLWTRETTHP